MPRREEPSGSAASSRPDNGFTLIEILLALAVIGLVSALLVPGLGAMFRSLDNTDPAQVLGDAVTAARGCALSAGRPVYLRLDREKRQLRWGDAATQAKTWPADTDLRFLRAQAGPTVLLGGRLVETEEIPAVRFYPDGTCDRFRAQISSGSGPDLVCAIDPWTCAPVLGGGSW